MGKNGKGNTRRLREPQMKKNSPVFTILFIGLFVLTVIIFYWFLKSSYYLPFQVWISANKALYVSALFLIKSIGILWPPIPSGLLTMASIPFLGWQTAYLVDLSGSAVGGSVSYFLGKKYGLTFLKKIFDDKILDSIKNLKIKKGKEIEAVFVYRILLGTVIVEAIYYGGGLLKVNFPKFLVGAVLSHIVTGVPVFILAQNIFGGKNIVITTLLVVISGFFVYKTKGRYFE